MLTDVEKQRCQLVAVTMVAKSKAGGYESKMTEADLQEKIDNATVEDLIILMNFKRKAEARKAHMLSLCDQVLNRYQ